MARLTFIVPRYLWDISALKIKRWLMDKDLGGLWALFL